MFFPGFNLASSSTAVPAELQDEQKPSFVCSVWAFPHPTIPVFSLYRLPFQHDAAFEETRLHAA